MRELKLRLPDDEAAGIDLLAQARGINRAECLRQLIRNATTAQQPVVVNLNTYHRLSTEIYRQLGGIISKLHAEQAAAIAVKILATPQQ
jgi:hypothetical protein